MSRTWRDTWKIKARRCLQAGDPNWLYYLRKSGGLRDKHDSWDIENRSRLERMKKDFENKYPKRSILQQVCNALYGVA